MSTHSELEKKRQIVKHAMIATYSSFSDKHHRHAGYVASSSSGRCYRRCNRPRWTTWCVGAVTKSSVLGVLNIMFGQAGLLICFDV